MPDTPTMIADYECEVGEGPLWHPDERCVYWTDIPTGRLFRYDPASGQHEQCYEGDPVGGFTIQSDGSLLLFMNCGAVKVWRDGAILTLIDGIPDEAESRFNDVIADPEGRVFCGTMPTETSRGRLYRLDTDLTLTIVLDGIACSNGMGFTLDRRRMYYTDSLSHEIYIFDYEQTTGEISNKRVFVRIPDDDGIPDGMTVDAEGSVWSARWDGWCLTRYRADGVEDRRIQFPAKRVSCVTFGGEDYTDMYVTTAGGENRSENGSGAGALYSLRAGVRGLPEFLSRIAL